MIQSTPGKMVSEDGTMVPTWIKTIIIKNVYEKLQFIFTQLNNVDNLNLLDK